MNKMGNTVLKLKPTSKNVRQPKTISLEDYIQAREDNINARHEIDAKINNTLRTIEVVEALEELAVVADNISEANQNELNLIELGGNIAVAGTEVAPEKVIPSLESYLGTKISTEDFDLKGKIAKIWEVIKKAFKEIWVKINEFLKSSSIMVGVSMNRIRKVEAKLKDLKNRKVASDVRIELEMDEKDWIHTRTDRFILNDGERTITDPKRIIEMLNNTKRFVEEYFDTYPETLSDIIDSLAKSIGEIGSNKDATQVAREIMEMMKVKQLKLFNGVIVTNKFHEEKSKDETKGLRVIKYKTDLIGAPDFTVTIPGLSDIGSDSNLYIDRLRNCRVKMSLHTDDEIKRGPDQDRVYSMEDMLAMNDVIFDIVKQCKHFKDRGAEDKLKSARKKLESVSDNLKNKVKNDLKQEDISAINSILSLNLAVINWTRYPLIDVIGYCLKTERAINWLLKHNMDHLVDKPKEPKQPT